MAVPTIPLRAIPLEMAWRKGDAGCSKRAVDRQAEIMKVPSAQASIRYSGQCVVMGLRAFNNR